MPKAQPITTATQNNLGNTLVILGERQGDKLRLVGAKKIILLAQDVFRETGATLYDDDIKERLQRIDDLIQRIDSGKLAKPNAVQ